MHAAGMTTDSGLPPQAAASGTKSIMFLDKDEKGELQDSLLQGSARTKKHGQRLEVGAHKVYLFTTRSCQLMCGLHNI